MAEAAGVEIPKGSPEDLHSAAGAWKAVGATLKADAGRLDRATSAVVSADWHGPASTSFSSSSLLIGSQFSQGSSACERAADACTQFSTALKAAQDAAKHAKRRAEHAITRRDAARHKATAARDAITAANTAAENAAHSAATATAAGPAGAGALHSAHSAGRAAGQAREAAEDDLREALKAIRAAEHDLTEARKDGEEANHDAERAGRHAAQTFQSVGAEAQPIDMPGIPVPVSLRKAVVDGMPSPGDPFHGPGRFGTPGAARAAQIEAQENAANDAAEAAKPKKGTIWDGLSGVVHTWTFDLVDLGGDHNSDRYRGGTLAGYIPLTPMSAIRDVEKIGAKVVAKKAEKKAIKEAEEKAAAALAKREARQAAKLDRRPGEKLKETIARHQQEYEDALEAISKDDLKRAAKTDIMDHVSKVVNHYLEHRIPGLPDFIVAMAKDWPTTKAAAQYGLEILKKFLHK